jgi:hypothetical protein
VAGDFDGDGFGDFAVGSAGGIVIYRGPSLAPRTYAWPLAPGALVGVGDVNADNFDDLLFVDDAHGVYLFYGGPALVTPTDAGSPWPQPTVAYLAAAATGTRIAAGVGDVNGDGLPDVFIADSVSNCGATAGGLYTAAGAVSMSFAGAIAIGRAY